LLTLRDLQYSQCFREMGLLSLFRQSLECSSDLVGVVRKQLLLELEGLASQFVQVEKVPRGPRHLEWHPRKDLKAISS
jgi:hypothetical protein